MIKKEYNSQNFLTLFDCNDCSNKIDLRLKDERSILAEVLVALH